jgi:CBS domain-containing protein
VLVRLARDLYPFSGVARTVDAVMTPMPDCCTLDDGAVEVARLMLQRDVGVVPIVESQETRRLVGVITDRDLVLRIMAEGIDPNEVVGMRDVMSEPVVTCSGKDDLPTVESLMKQHRLNRIIVVDEQQSVVGVVATADLARKVDEERVGDTVKGIREP